MNSLYNIYIYIYCNKNKNKTIVVIYIMYEVYNIAEYIPFIKTFVIYVIIINLIFIIKPSVFFREDETLKSFATTYSNLETPFPLILFTILIIILIYLTYKNI